MRRITPLITILIITAAIASPLAAQVTQGDVERARQELRQVSAALEDAAIVYEAAVQQELALNEELDRLAIAISASEREAEMARLESIALVVELYMSAGTTEVTDLLAADTVELPARLAYVGALADAERTTVNRLLAVEASFAAQQERLAEALGEQQAVRAELDLLNEQIGAELVEADANYRSVLAAWERQEAERRAREEAARRAAAAAAAAAAAEAAAAAAAAAAATSTTVATSTTEAGATTTTVAGDTTTTAPPAPSGGGLVCPVAGASSFTDTWGAPRSGGRAHRGVDMMAPRGTPLVAIETGSILRLSSSSLGGITLYLRGDSGDVYYYAHMDTYASGMSSGVAVTAGQSVGTVGSSGNADYSAPHLHFEFHPGGGGAVNPTPLVRSLCG